MINIFDLKRIISTEFEQTFSCVLQCKPFVDHADTQTFHQFNCCNSYICESCITELKNQVSKPETVYFDDDYDDLYTAPEIYKQFTCPACKTKSPKHTEIQKLQISLLNAESNINREIGNHLTSQGPMNIDKNDEKLYLLQCEKPKMQAKIVELQQKYTEARCDRRSAMSYFHSLEGELVDSKAANLKLENKVTYFQQRLLIEQRSSPYFELDMLREELFEIISEMDALKSEKFKLKIKNKQLSIQNHKLKTKLINFE